MEWKLILQTGGKGISREGQEFGGGGGTSRFCASLFLSFHCSPFSAIISDQGRTRGFSYTCVCGGGLAFSGSAFGIVSPGSFPRRDMVARDPWASGSYWLEKVLIDPLILHDEDKRKRKNILLVSVPSARGVYGFGMRIGVTASEIF